MRQPPSLQRRIKEESISQKQKGGAKQSEKREELIEDMKLMKQMLQTMLQHLQGFLKWLIDLGLNPEMAKLQVQQAGEETCWTLLLLNYTNQRIWLEQLTFTMELYIKTSDEIKEQGKTMAQIAEGVLEKIPEEEIIADGEIDGELAPLAVSRSISLPMPPKHHQQQPSQAANSLSLIKSLVQLLYINEQSIV